MGKFNKSNSSDRIVTHEGAEAVRKDVVDDFVNNLFSSYLEDSYYEDGNEVFDRFVGLTQDVRKSFGDEFTFKLAKFARKELGMRSASQVVAALLNDSKSSCKREMYRTMCNRPDDCAEVFSILDRLGSKPSHAMVRGFGDYLSSLQEYYIGKYKMLGKAWNMYDLVNVTHAHSPAIDKLKAGTLDSPDTWEVSISASEDDDERSRNWIRLVEERKLGYNALLMNLRNILASVKERSWVKDVLCPQIVDETSIRRSLMFPYKIYNAYKNYASDGRNILVDEALNKAFEISCSLVPRFYGKTLVVLDVSGSMDSQYSKMSALTIAEISAVYAAAFIMNNDVDVIKFGTEAEYFKYSRGYDSFSLINRLQDNDRLGYGTVIGSVYDKIDRHYDRILLFSDMQVMEGAYLYPNNVRPIEMHDAYCRRYGQCPMYSFDLGNYNSHAVSKRPDAVRFFTALSPEVFRFLQLVESDKPIYEYIMENY